MISVVGWVVISWLIADFLSGLFHFLEDRFAQPDWPVIGPYVAIPNQKHHDEPLAFLDNTYWGRNWTTIVPSAVLALILCNDLWSALPFIFLSQANEVHAWSHMKGKLSWPIVMLQDAGILCSPKQHAEHHTEPHLNSYCVMSDILNPVLNQTMFWYSIADFLHRMGIKDRNEITPS